MATDKANSELDRALRPLRARQTGVDKLEHRGDVRQEQVDLWRDLESASHTCLRLEDVPRTRQDQREAGLQGE